MAATVFLNFCKWNSTTSGTTTFTVGTAAAADAFGSHDIPANCGAVNGNTYRYFAQSPDGLQFESGRGVYSSGTLTRVTITQNSAGTTTPLNFTVNPVVDIFERPPRQVDGTVVVNYTPVNKAGDTMTGDLQVNSRVAVGGAPVSGAAVGDISVIRTSAPSTGVLYLGNSGARYLYFDGTSYQLGSAGTIWHTGNINPVISLRAAYAADLDQSNLPTSPGGDNYGSQCAISGIYINTGTGNVAYRFRYHQYQLSDGNWYNFN